MLSEGMFALWCAWRLPSWTSAVASQVEHNERIMCYINKHKVLVQFEGSDSYSGKHGCSKTNILLELITFLLNCPQNLLIIFKSKDRLVVTLVTRLSSTKQLTPNINCFPYIQENNK